MSTRADFLNVLFNEGDQVILGRDVHERPPSPITLQEAKNSDLTFRFVCINPANEKRDSGITNFRNIVLDFDEKTLEEQLEIIRRSEVPRSALIFSGNKSYHLYISLEEPLFDLASYQKLVARTHQIFETNYKLRPDPQVKSPSNWARLGGAIREGGAEQRIVELNKRVSLKELERWLKNEETKVPEIANTKPKSYGRVSNFTKDLIINGGFSHSVVMAGGRSNASYKSSRDLNEQGYEQEEIFDYLSSAPDLVDERPSDKGGFPLKELRSVVKSAFARPPKYPPRMPEYFSSNQNETLRNFILDATLVVNMQDSEDFLIYSKNQGKVERIDEKVIERTVGRETLKEIYKNQLVAKFQYRPDVNKKIFIAEDGFSVFNIYQPPDYLRNNFFFNEPIDTASVDCPELIAKFFSHLFNGDNTSINFNYDWLTTALRGRNQTYLTLLGEEGTGKGVYGYLLANLVGHSNYAKVRDEIFKHKFNGQIANRKIIHIDELKLTTDEHLNRAKDLVNEFIEIEKKGEDAVNARNFANIYICSNNIDAVKVSGKERRFSILDITEESLLKNLTVGEIQQLQHDPKLSNDFALWLYHRKVTSDMNQPFRGEKFNDVRDAGLKDWEREIIEGLANEKRGQTITLKVAQEYIRKLTWLNLNQIPGNGKFKTLASRFPEVFRFYRASKSKDYWLQFLEIPKPQ